MNRQLTERLIGGVVVLVTLVVVAPVLLDGGGQRQDPAREDDRDGVALRTHTVHLDETGRSPPIPQPAATSLPPADEARSAAALDPRPVPQPPATAEGLAGAVADVDEPQPAAETPAGKPVQPAAPAPAAAAATEAPPPARSAVVSSGTTAEGQWVVQLGSFQEKANADALAARVRARGFSVVVVAGDNRGVRYWRVRSGPYASREQGAEQVRRLDKAGFKAQVTPR